MSEFAANLTTFFGGAVGGGIGFVIIGFIILVLFAPILMWMRRADEGHKRSGLERFAASLDTPDEGDHDLIPPASRDRFPSNR